MRFTPTLFALLLPFLTIAQQKGSTPIRNSSIVNRTSETYAVIVGISDYQNPDIPDLRFAHKDAAAFAEYLQSPAGGSLKDNHLKLLLNENATTAQIAAALEWLVEVCREGERAIIYFSGHGDVETKTMFQLGYLLTWDSPARTYVAGAFPLQYLQAIVSTLALQNKAEVTLITDACRAGKLAGTDVGGAQITNNNLSKQFANEVKILSCQPDEFSLEGEQWGGGRGVFSHHLLDGLYGLADNNADKLVNLFEIGRYLEDKVSSETSPHSQFPMIVGSKTTTMAMVDENSLAQLKKQRAKHSPVLASVESKGFEDMILAGLDSVWQKKYRQFTVALDKGLLLDAPVGEQSAYELYFELQKAIELKKLHGTMQRNLAAALQDEAQQAINAYLEANPTELAKRYESDADYERYPRYLQKAAEILGSENFYYPYVMAKRFYFEGLQMRLDADNKVENASFEKAIQLQLKALEFQEHAPFVLNELGVLNTHLKWGEKAVAYYKKAIELAPEWGVPYVNLCLEYFYNNDLQGASEIGDKALELLPEYPQLYNLLGWVNSDLWEHLDKRTWERRGVELKEDFGYGFDNFGTLYQRKEKFEKSIRLLKKALELDTTYAVAHGNLGLILMQVDSQTKAEYHIKKAISLNPTIWEFYIHLGIVLYWQSKYEEAETVFYKTLELTPKNNTNRLAAVFNSMGNMYRYWGKTDKAVTTFERTLEIQPNYNYNLGDLYFDLGEFQKAEQNVLKYVIAKSNYPGGFLWLGNFYKKTNRFEDAKWMYLKALEVKPGYLQVLDNLVDLYEKYGDFERALELQQQWLETAPNDPLPFFTAGRIAYLNKQPAKAESFFKKAVEIASDRFIPNEVAAFYIRHSEFDLAEEYLQTARAVDSTFSLTFINLSALYRFRGEPEKGLEILDAGIDLQETERGKSNLIYRKAVLYNAMGEMDKCIQYAKEAETIEPAYHGMGLLTQKLKEKDYPLVAAMLSQFIEKFPKTPETHFFHCEMLLRSGETAEAQDAFVNAVENGIAYEQIRTSKDFERIRQLPIYEETMRRYFPEKYTTSDSVKFSEKEGNYYLENCVTLAKFYEREGEYPQAHWLFEKAVDLKPDTLSKELALSLAEVYLNLDRLEEARLICPKNITFEKSDELLGAAKLLYKLGKKEQAQILFEKYISLPQNAPTSGDPNANVGHFYKDHDDFELAEPLLKTAMERKPEIMATRRNLARLYFFAGKKDQAYQVLQESIRLAPGDLATRGIHCMLSYYDMPEESKHLFEQSGFLSIWECLELMRQNRYDEADLAWKELQKETTAWWLEFAKYKYLQMKIRQGESEHALQLFNEILAKEIFANYRLFKADVELDPIRNTTSFQKLMRRYFPEKLN